MHIFNMSTTGMQGFKKIHYKLWEELITQVSDMGFTAHQHKKAISRRIRYIK